MNAREEPNPLAFRVSEGKMDYNRVQKSLGTEVSRLFKARHPEKGVVIDIPGFEVRVERIRGLQKQIHLHVQNQASRLKKAELSADITARYRDAQKGLETGAIFVSFDIERTLEEKTEEIGITVYQNGAMRTRNIRIEGKTRFNDCDFCETEIMTIPEAMTVLAMELSPASFVVGHSLHHDFAHMKSLGFSVPPRRRLDTAYLTLLQYENAPKLVALCAEYGVDAPVPHVGGNDSRYAMELLLKLVERFSA